MTVILTLLALLLISQYFKLEVKANRYANKAMKYRLIFFLECMAYWLILIYMTETRSFEPVATVATVILTLAAVRLIYLIEGVVRSERR